MKRGTIIALFAASILSAGATSYAVQSITDKTTNHFVEEGTVPAHFASYQKEAFPDLTYAAENAVRAVVSIEAIQSVKRESRERQSPFFDFFGIPEGYFESPQGQAPQQQRRSGGSGVLITADGYIVSNNHVVENATELKVTLNDKRSFSAKVVGTDPTTDIALLKIEGNDLPYLPFGDSDALRLGEWVLAIGTPFNLTSTVTAGIVSAKARNLDVIPSQFRLESFIQTDAAVNPGNSGGALTNTKGELVGINTVIKSPTGSYAGYSFAVPSAIVKKVITDIKEFGVVQRALLGIEFQEINDEFIERLGKETGIKERGGIYVARVSEGGAAEAAGIKKGDVLVEFEGMKIDGSAQLFEQIAKYRPNDKVKVSIKRDGEVKQFDVVLRNKAGKTEPIKKDAVDLTIDLGAEFAEISDKVKRDLKIESGIRVMSISEGGILSKTTIKPGCIIIQINETPIRSISDLTRITSDVESIEVVFPNGRIVIYALTK